MRLPVTDIVPAAAAEAPVLANLLELYIHDFSEFMHLELGSDGRYGYPTLPLYWSDPERHPFLIKIDGMPAGFILLMQTGGGSGEGATWDLAEFFIVRGWRRSGVGKRAAQRIWSEFPGQWQVRVMEKNLPALGFWTRAVGEFVGREVTPLKRDGRHGPEFVFSFES